MIYSDSVAIFQTIFGLNLKNDQTQIYTDMVALQGTWPSLGLRVCFQRWFHIEMEEHNSMMKTVLPFQIFHFLLLL